MGKKITLADIAKILKKDKTKGDTSYWGVVQSTNTDSQGKVTSYNVSLGGDTGTVKCRKLAGAKVNDTVLVTLRSTGEAVVVGTKNGDTDASDAQSTATSAQDTAETAQDTAETAQGTAEAAQQTAAAAQNTANSASSAASSAYDKAAEVENHFWYDSSGVHISLAKPIGSSTLNTLINSGGMAIRKGTTELAKFTDTLIELGKNSNTATIKLCGGSGIIKYISGTGGGVYFGLPIANNYKSGITARGTEVEITSGDYNQGSWLKIADGGISAYSAAQPFAINNIKVSGTISLPNGSYTAQIRGSDSGATIVIPGISGVTASGSAVMATSGGRLASGSSTRRIKTDISDIQEEALNPRKLYDATVRQFRYKEGVLTKDDEKYGQLEIGLIAEELDEIYPAAVLHSVDDNGNVQCDDWNFRQLVPAMLKLIQEQHTEIEEIKERISV